MNIESAIIFAKNATSTVTQSWMKQGLEAFAKIHLPTKPINLRRLRLDWIRRPISQAEYDKELIEGTFRLPVALFDVAFVIPAAILPEKVPVAGSEVKRIESGAEQPALPPAPSAPSASPAEPLSRVDPDPVVPR